MITGRQRLKALEKEMAELKERIPERPVTKVIQLEITGTGDPDETMKTLLSYLQKGPSDQGLR